MYANCMDGQPWSESSDDDRENVPNQDNMAVDPSFYVMTTMDDSEKNIDGLSGVTEDQKENANGLLRLFREELERKVTNTAISDGPIPLQISVNGDREIVISWDFIKANSGFTIGPKCITWHYIMMSDSRMKTDSGVLNNNTGAEMSGAVSTVIHDMMG